MIKDKEFYKRIATKHGGKGTRLYRIWSGMKNRCNNPNADAYGRYGGVGVTVCNEWIDFVGFRDWALNNGYEDTLTIDRVDNTKGYTPDNCRWVTRSVQARNTRVLKTTNKTGYRGVRTHKGRTRVSAQIYLDGKCVHLGMFDTALEAAKIYDRFIIDNNLEHTRNFE